MTPSPESKSIQCRNDQVCFFCLRNSQNHSQFDLPYDPIGLKIQPASLKNVFKFLSVSHENIEDARVRRELSIAKRECDLLVTSCQHCSEIIIEFSNLYNYYVKKESTETRLRLNWYLQKLHNVMTYAELRPTILPIDVANLRTMTKGDLKSSFSRDQTLPQLKLSREGKSANKSQELISRIPCEDLKTDQAIPSKPEGMQKCPAKPIDDHVSCSLCLAKFQASNKSNGTYYGPWQLKNHNLKHHIETFFPNHKLDTVTESQFRKILVDLLFRFFLSGNKFCSICDWPFLFSKHDINHEFPYHPRNKMHFIDAHFKILEEKLAEVQRDPDLLTKLSKVNPKGRMCKNKCGVYIKNGYTEKVHQKFCRLADAKQKWIISFPPPILKAKNVRKANQRSVIRENIKDDKQFGAFQDEENVKMEADIGEPFPAKRMKLEADDDLHDQGVSKINPVKRNKFRSKITAKLKRKPAKSKSNEEIACSFCRAKFQYHTNPKLTKHMVSYHCEQYFPTQKHDSISDSQFRKILVDILFQDFITGKSCRICDQPFSNAKDKIECLSRKKLHFIQNHFNELEEKLNEIQNDPQLPTKLEKCNPTGRMCKNNCGVYIADKDVERAHDAFHCNNSPLLKNSKQNYFLPRCSRGKFHGSHVGRVQKIKDNVCKISANKDETGEEMKLEQSEDMSLMLLKLTSCPYCNFKCKPNCESLTRHVARLHTEHFFFGTLGIDQMENDIAIKQLRRIFEHILFPKLMPGVGDKCIYCNKIFNCRTGKDNRYNLKVHLVQQHEAEMNEALKSIQKDPQLQEKLASFKGKFCRCAMYFPCGETRRKLMYHKRYMCKYLPIEKS